MSWTTWLQILLYTFFVWLMLMATIQLWRYGPTKKNDE